nr:hypothetical protein [Actinomycetota bacterium]
GFVSAYPCTQGRPTASNVNYSAGQTVADLVALQPDANGDVCFYTNTPTDVIWDQTVETSAVTSHNAVRLLDTPTTGPSLGAGQSRQLHVTGTGAATVFGTLTVTNPTGPGFVSAYPCTQGRPTASNVNYSAGRTVADLVAVQPDANGDVCFYTNTPTDVIWDQTVETSAVTSHNAVRLLDTRVGSS